MGLGGYIQMIQAQSQSIRGPKSTEAKIGALANFVSLKESIISICKFVVGFVGLGSGINNLVQQRLSNRQEEELNKYLIFISCYFIVEGSDMVYDIFTEKFLKKSEKSINEGKSNKDECISRIFQLIPTLFYAGFSIGGFFTAKRDVDPLQFDFTHVAQNFDYTASYEDAQELTDSYASEYLTFSILTVLVCAQNAYTVIFPKALLGVYSKDSSRFIKSGFFYSLIFGLFQAIVGIVITLNYNSLDMSFLNKDNKVLEDYQLSQKTSQLFSTGAETLFLILHFIDMIVDEMVLLLPSSLYCSRKSGVIKCIGRVYSFTFFFLLPCIVNLAIAICQALSADYLLRNFEGTNLNSPIFLFVVSLILESFENFLDFIFITGIYLSYAYPRCVPNWCCFICFQLSKDDDEENDQGEEY
eukprot:403366198